MKSFSKEHKERLSKINVKEFQKQCIKDLKSFQLYEYGYPSNQEDIEIMVEHGYIHIKKLFGLKSQKEIKIALIAIHLGGVKFLHDEGYNNFLRSKDVPNEQKVIFLEKFIHKQLDVINTRMKYE